MKYRVLMLQDAEEDIFNIYRFIAWNDSKERAGHIFSKLQQTCLSLTEHPERGHLPPELERVDVIDYQEIHFKPYRIIYEIEGKSVFIHCVMDGRRDLQDLLQDRLLR